MSQNGPGAQLRTEVAKALVGVDAAGELPEQLRIAICETLAWACELDVALAGERRAPGQTPSELPPAAEPRAALPPGTPG